MESPSTVPNRRTTPAIPGRPMRAEVRRSAVGNVRPGPLSGSAALRTLFEGASDVVLFLEPDGTIGFANRVAHTLLAAASDRLEGRRFYDLVHPYDHASCQAWIRKLVAGELADAAAGRIRLTLRGPAGRDLSFEGTATPQREGGRITLLHAMFVDVTEREREASASQETAELFQLLSQHAPWGVFITDAAGRLRFANPRWRALADLLHVPAPRGVWWQMVHPGDRDRVLVQWQSALAGGHEFAAEYRVNLPDPEPRWVRTRLAQSWGPDGRLRACVGITEDITLERQADEVMRRANEGLEEVVKERTEELSATNRELTNLVYAVTHDLKSPLRGISRLADWLAEDHAAQLSPEGSTLIVKMQARVRQLHTLIDGILAYSRIGRSTDADRPVDLNTVVTDVVRLLDPPPHVTVSVPEPLPTVTGIPHQLHQLFQNFLDNATKFMDKPQGRIQITCRRAGPAWEFTVHDNGPGIPARFHEKIFNLFQRLDTLPDRPGAGIGLALIKRIIETRGGHIRVDSEEGHGTSFSFTWPDVGRAAARRTAPPLPA